MFPVSFLLVKLYTSSFYLSYAFIVVGKLLVSDYNVVVRTPVEVARRLPFIY